ncbi:MAG: DUF4177 domain-containing protein [bacterium]|nr:DUF4177 domain-containing protein [bacterium]
MERFEYKVVALKAKGFGVVKATAVPELETELNKLAKVGWRLKSVIPPGWGGVEKVIAVLEREVVVTPQ